MAEQTGAPDAAPITDHRPVPRGVVPRRFQTWLMVGLAAGIVLIILLTGERQAPTKPVPAAAAPAAATADRVREYQERLREMEARQVLDSQSVAPVPGPEPRSEPAPAPHSEDPVAIDRKRREYESLFASNVVSSRRPEPERPDSAGTRPSSAVTMTPPRESSLDEIAEAVVRATGGASVSARRDAAPSAPSPPSRSSSPPVGEDRTPERTAPINPSGPMHPLLEGTVIDAVLTNRLDGNGVAPVNCLVTNPVYSYNGQYVLIPAGARLLGQTRPVQALGETRLAVGFHRLLMPDGSTQRLDQFLGLNQIGDAGLRDKVNQHYWSTFGAAGAVGLISGLAQSVGTAGLTGGTGDRTVIIAGGTADAASQASLQVMNRFLNRLPTITIGEGHRVKVYLTSDLQLPAYEPTAIAARVR
jgi:type IV secretory pathway VirB10-like protein